MDADLKQRITRHGETLKLVFGLDPDLDPVRLCKTLRRLENRARVINTLVCNGDLGDDEAEAELKPVKDKVGDILGESGVPVFVNRDPRGCAFKIDYDWMVENRDKPGVAQLYRDMGGYGVVAPDLREV